MHRLWLGNRMVLTAVLLWGVGVQSVAWGDEVQEGGEPDGVADGEQAEAQGGDHPAADSAVMEGMEDTVDVLFGAGLNNVKVAAEAALAQGNLWEPDGDNALHHYRRLVEAEPDDYFAAEFEEKLLASLRRAADNRLRRRDWEGARSAVAALKELDADDAVAARVGNRLDALGR